MDALVWRKAFGVSGEDDVHFGKFSPSTLDKRKYSGSAYIDTVLIMWYYVLSCGFDFDRTSRNYTKINTHTHTHSLSLPLSHPHTHFSLSCAEISLQSIDSELVQAGVSFSHGRDREGNRLSMNTAKKFSVNFLFTNSVPGFTKGMSLVSPLIFSKKYKN